ncbi:MAG: hypothetical protein ACE5DN_05840, partial [Flavobacteriales bacterium]
MKSLKWGSWLLIMAGISLVAWLGRLKVRPAEMQDTALADTLPPVPEDSILPDTTTLERLQFKLDELCDATVMKHATWG